MGFAKGGQILGGAEWLFNRIRNISVVVTLENSDAEESEYRPRYRLYSRRIFVIFFVTCQLGYRSCLAHSLHSSFTSYNTSEGTGLLWFRAASRDILKQKTCFKKGFFQSRDRTSK